MLEKEKGSNYGILLKLYKPSSLKVTDAVSASVSCLGKDTLYMYEIYLVPLCEPSNGVALPNS